MAQASLAPIYNRLASAPRYHPMSSDTFADWSMEAGDIVTVSRDGQSYSAPVHTSTLKWHGKQQISIRSEGDKERPPLSIMSQRKYASSRSGGGGHYGQQDLYWEMESEDGTLHATISATAEALTTSYTKDIGDTKAALEGTITQTAEAYQRVYMNKLTDVESKVEQTADSIGLIVDSTTGSVTPAKIIAAINDNKSSVKIGADQIFLEGNVLLSGILKVSNGMGIFPGGIAVGSGASTGYINSQGSATLRGLWLLTGGGQATNMMNAIVRADPSGNRLRLYNASGEEVVNFSKATTLGGAWSSGIYTVTATQNGATVGTKATTITTISGPRSITSNGTYTFKVMYESDSGADADTGYPGATVTVDVSSGHDISMPSTQIYTTSGSAPSGYSQASTLKTRILQAIEDGDKVCFRIDCGSAKQGYWMQF